ncbi:MAG: glucose-6-phosphate isomerase [Eubacteriales bacterium]|nr:glucose-6-phosphate isomerase [Clostridiales bacterium]MDD6933562.1 glucose-6-phosphate isomerase [Eubacteriales bacterium]MDO4387939.1 glucose-6-phosphate isomerase [Eubacteriales bacterium]MDY2602648.1 glucose-6-phosphate isomerase [Eubacteriales bacterium]
MDMRIKLDVNPMFREFTGEHAIPRAELDSMLPELKKAHAAVEAGRGKGMQGWMDLPYNQDEILTAIENTAARVRKEFEAFVVLGIGGSALGPAAVQQALNHLHYNELPAEKRGGPRLYIEDNVDPERMAALLDVIDLKKTCFNVITKSGGTAETMSQYLIITDALKKAVGDDYKRHIIITTSQTKGFLIKIAQREGYETFYIPDGVGGRFSELCPVGLIAAAVTGIDIRGLIAGAKDMDQRCASDDAYQNPALMDAGLMVLAMRHGVNMSVMMPYADSLKLMADWYAQLWAESLGKNETLDGEKCHVGQTPIKTLGVTDQHSQLQLYTEGPFDKALTFLKVESFRATTAIPHGCDDIPTIAFLGGKSHNQLIEAERKGTEYALYKSGRMSQTITLPEVNANTVGQLIYFFELVTAYSGALLNINTFNQPGVEESKIAAYAVMGYESDIHTAKREEMKNRPEPKAEFQF